MAGPPEDRPTEPLRPRSPVERESFATDDVDRRWAAEIDDQLRSLKGMLALIGVLALAALGVALYDLLRDDGRGDGGASQERVAQLDDRVERLESKAGDAPAESDVEDLRQDLQKKADQSDVQQLSDDIESLGASVEEVAAADETTAEQIVQLSERVDELEAEVQELQDQSAQQP